MFLVHTTKTAYLCSSRGLWQIDKEEVSDPPIKWGRNILELIHRRAYPNGQKQNFKEIKITVP